MSNFIWENKNNQEATKGRSWSGTVDGQKKTFTESIRYSVNVPTFQTVENFCNEVAALSEGAKNNLLSLLNVAVANSYCNKATEHVARDIEVEDWNLETFFTMSGNREGVGKAISLAEEQIQELTNEKMIALSEVNGILTKVISGKIKMEDAPTIQAELQSKVAELDSRIAEQNERLAKLEVIRKEQQEKNKVRGAKAAASRKANAEE